MTVGRLWVRAHSETFSTDSIDVCCHCVLGKKESGEIYHRRERKRTRRGPCAGNTGKMQKEKDRLVRREEGCFLLGPAMFPIM
uniref:Uncharacterized protein n=1 Tax=Knipowitschia caucasica TaxID=637954 RepID=A0AAV2IZK6_KNICA